MLEFTAKGSLVFMAKVDEATCTLQASSLVATHVPTSHEQSGGQCVGVLDPLRAAACDLCACVRRCGCLVSFTGSGRLLSVGGSRRW